MNNSAKTVLTGALLTVVLAASSAHAQGRAGNSSDYADNSAQSVEIIKVSLQKHTAVDALEVNR